MLIAYKNQPKIATVQKAARLLSGIPSLSKNPGVDKGPQPLMFNPALTTCASERMKTQRFSYFAGFAARRPAAAGQFRPVSRGGTSCFLREAKPVKTRKSGVQPLFRQSKRRHAPPFSIIVSRPWALSCSGISCRGLCRQRLWSQAQIWGRRTIRQTGQQCGRV